MLGRQIDDENVPLYCHINKDFCIPFGREEFCLLARLRFEVQNWVEYDTKERIPFRRRVFPSYLDGKPITSIDIENMSVDQSFAQLYDNDVKGNMPAARLTPDTEARSDWWISKFDEQKREIKRNKKEVDNIKEEMRKFRQEMNVQPVRQENKEPIIVEQHYGLSDFSQFQSMQGGPSSFQRHVNSSYFNMGTPSNFQTPMSSQPGSSDWQRQMPAQSATQYWQPDISSVSLEKSNKECHRSTNIKILAVEPGSYNSFGQVPSHMGRPDLQTTIETHHDVDGIFDQNIPNREKREQFPSKLPYGTLIGWLSGEHINSWMELLIRRRIAKANWTVAYTGTISVHPENNRFIVPTDQHVIGTLDGTTHPYPAWNDVDWPDKKFHKWQKFMSFEPDIPEIPVYKAKPNISMQYTQQSEVEKGNIFYDKEALILAVRKLQIFVSYTPIDLSTVLIPNNGSLEESLVANSPKNVRLTVLMKLQEALDEEAILEEQMLALMHRFADRFTNRRVEINNMMVLHDHPLIDYGKYALGCMTGADMKKCVKLKGIRDELLRSMEEKRQLMTNYRNM
uniref:Uncharacterized protein n=1 Tax=Tanacetum cinerariifolium TaxID=118510 RepID=A0A6L2NT81_TANCI|nr:hypothetical protein [Tanacetum cinerariifolium]